MVAQAAGLSGLCGLEGVREMALDPVFPERGQSLSDNSWLYRCEDRSPFAFARGDEFMRYADHTRWARLSDDRLVSERSGACLAYRVGNVFYDPVSHEPLYYQPPLIALPAHRPGAELAAVRATREANPHRTANDRRSGSVSREAVGSG